MRRYVRGDDVDAIETERVPRGRSAGEMPVVKRIERASQQAQPAAYVHLRSGYPK